MGKYNRTFDLDIEELELIETAIRQAVSDAEKSGIDPQDANDLLGKLHNQKIFFRPRKGIYVSG